MMALTVCFPLPHLCCPGVSPVALQPGSSPSWLSPPTGSAPSQRSRTSCTVWTNQRRTVRQPGRVSQPLDRGPLMHSAGQVMCASGRGAYSALLHGSAHSYLPVAGDVEAVPAVVGDGGRRLQPQGQRP